MENKEKFVLARTTPTKRNSTTVTRIYITALAKLNALSEQTNMSTAQLIEKMVDYCLERLEVVE